MPAARHRLDVRFARVGRARASGPRAQLALFRVLQEAMTNVGQALRQGHRGRGDAELRGAGGACGSTIDGKGFVMPGTPTLSPEGHYGLANMRERANKVGGQISRMASGPARGRPSSCTVHAGEEQQP